MIDMRLLDLGALKAREAMGSNPCDCAVAMVLEKREGDLGSL